MADARYGETRAQEQLWLNLRGQYCRRPFCCRSNSPFRPSVNRPATPTFLRSREQTVHRHDDAARAADDSLMAKTANGDGSRRRTKGYECVRAMHCQSHSYGTLGPLPQAAIA